MTSSAFANRRESETLGGPLRGARTLVVEDSAILATELAEILNGFGCYVVGMVATVAAVRRLVETVPIDAAVVDINLNGLRTFEPATLLQERGIPIVFLSGYSETSVPARFQGARFLRKPLDPDLLAAALGQAVQTSVDARRAGFSCVD